MSNILIVYVALAVCVWALQACAFYAYLQRKEPDLAAEHRGLHTWFSLLLSAITSIVWPIFLPFMYFRTEQYRYGFAIPGYDPLRKD